MFEFHDIVTNESSIRSCCPGLGKCDDVRGNCPLPPLALAISQFMQVNCVDAGSHAKLSWGPAHILQLASNAHSLAKWPNRRHRLHWSIFACSKQRHSANPKITVPCSINTFCNANVQLMIRLLYWPFVAFIWYMRSIEKSWSRNHEFCPCNWLMMSVCCCSSVDILVILICAFTGCTGFIVMAAAYLRLSDSSIFAAYSGDEHLIVNWCS